MTRKFAAPSTPTTPLTDPVCSVLSGVNALFVFPTAVDTLQYFKTGDSASSVTTRSASTGTTFDATEGQIEQTSDGTSDSFVLPDDLLGTALNSGGPFTIFSFYETNFSAGPSNYPLTIWQNSGSFYGFNLNVSGGGRLSANITNASWTVYLDGGFGPASTAHRVFVTRNTGAAQRLITGWGADATTTVTTSPGTVIGDSGERIRVGYSWKSGAGFMHFKGAIICAEALSDAQITAVLDEPGLLVDEGGSGLTKKLKCLIHPDAAGSTVSGVVFEAPTGSDLTGAEIGEFSGEAISATLESGEAVLKVAVADFGGDSLAVGATPVVVLKSATKTTPIFAAEVIEE